MIKDGASSRYSVPLFLIRFPRLTWFGLIAVFVLPDTFLPLPLAFICSFLQHMFQNDKYYCTVFLIFAL